MEKTRKVAVMGSGIIGSGWVSLFAMKGCRVSVYDIVPEQLENARERVNGNLQVFVKNGIIGAAEKEKIIGSIIFDTDPGRVLEDVCFIQESGPDKYEIKQEIIDTIDRHAPDDAVVASSTSGLSISKVAERSRFPGRIIGAHPFNPPHLIPLVELMKSEKTTDEVVDFTIKFYRSVGKVPVLLKKEVLGFIANRLTFALYREAMDLVLKGVCTVEDIDNAMLYGPGLRYAILGPNMLYELGAKDGIRGMRKLAQSVNKVYEDLAIWGARPDYWYDLAQEGVNEAKKNLPEYIGNTNEEIREYRDRMLIELLKLHHLL